MSLDALIIRITLGVLLLGAVLFGPWWMILVIGAIGALFFHFYIECVVSAFCVEVLYSPSFFFLTTFLSILVLLTLFLFKKLLRRDTMTL